MIRFVLCILIAGWMTGCAVNDSPLYLYMTQDELQHAIDQRYCAGMSFEAVESQMIVDGLTYFVDRDDTFEVNEVEGRLVQAGLQRETSPLFGRLILRFDNGALESVRYGSPIEDGGRWEYTRYRLEPCEQQGEESGVTP
ncbi:MAG: hypothetical protein ED559_11710 [Phycisphaera sp.]|nr:MAG: hypothetical protein ED559_11710 [Phycisphaera sp.]